MTSPYLDPRAQKYSSGSQNKQPGIGTVTYAQTLTSVTSDGLKQYMQPKQNMLSGAGKRTDQRRKQNPGFSI